MKNRLGILLLCALFACNTPRQGSNDFTANKSRVKDKGRTSASRRPARSSADRPVSRDTYFLDAVESRERSSAPSENAEAKSARPSANTSRESELATAGAAMTDRIVSESQKLLGVKYRYAGDSPSRGFDCSGLTCYLYRQADIALPRTSSEQSRLGKRKKFDQAEVGDLVFFGTGSRVTHVAIVVARSAHSMTIVHSTSSNGVRHDEVYSSKYWSSRRLWAVDHRSLIR